MPPHVIRHDSAVGGFRSIVLENDHLRAVIIPQLGGRIWELTDLARQREWIWHRDGVPLRAQPVGAVYDDVWAGGWEELFPNDAPCVFEGRDLPDHGEWWTMAWQERDPAGSPSGAVSLSASSHILRARCRKEIRLADDAGTLTVTYRIRSEEREPAHFLFKQHLPVAISPSCRLEIPGGQVQQVDASFGTMVSTPEPFPWPIAPGRNGRDADLRIVPDRAAAQREFVQVRDLPQPWCAVHDTERNASLYLRFDSPALPFLWLFLSYGGWRDTYTAVLEPCSNMPKDLAEAVRLGQSARLLPGDEFATSVSVTLTALASAPSDVRPNPTPRAR